MNNSDKTEKLTKYFSKQDAEYVLAHLLRWCGDVDNVIQWFEKTTLPEFGGRTAKQLCDQGDAKAVVTYIMHLEQGGYA
ncbi:antitoxin Xre/MbcA/ParS toxin-binding domain-containing protein [Agarivorans sp. DSG3-1]|uniref:antitoxin Xre/MbcA/ParS toxin-binding domain-containing protein n=1 Tax=Agarivorans sp. DSG3-1 TaxID=3342249 RepID=UPI00398E72AD